MPSHCLYGGKLSPFQRYAGIGHLLGVELPHHRRLNTSLRNTTVSGPAEVRPNGHRQSELVREACLYHGVERLLGVAVVVARVPIGKTQIGVTLMARFDGLVWCAGSIISRITRCQGPARRRCDHHMTIAWGRRKRVINCARYWVHKTGPIGVLSPEVAAALSTEMPLVFALYARTIALNHRAIDFHILRALYR